VWFTPICPRCRRTKHPNVTLSASWPKAFGNRHCSHCRIRWTAPESPFCSSHGNPEWVIKSLLYEGAGTGYARGLLVRALAQQEKTA
jgi:hypothetical protein